MELCAARQHCGHHGCADAAPDIAHEIDHSRGIVTLCRRQAYIHRQRDRNKQKRQTGNLRDAQPHCQLKLISRSIRLVERNIAPAIESQPKAIRYLAGILELSWPTIGIAINSTIPLAERTKAG